MRQCDGRRFLRSIFGLSQKLQPFHRRQRFNRRPFQLRDDNGWPFCCMVSWFWFDRIIWIIQFQFIGKFLCKSCCWYVASYHVVWLSSLSCLTGEVKPRQELPDVKPPTPEVGGSQCTGEHMLHMAVSENSGTPKSSILIGFSIINHPFWGTTI